MHEFAIEHWVARRGFYDSLVCLNLAACLETDDCECIAEHMREAKQKPYTALDVRLMLDGMATDPEEVAALLRINTLFKLLKDHGEVDGVSKATAQGYSEVWIGYARTFIKEALAYKEDLNHIVNLYKAACDALPAPTHPTDFTQVSAYPGKPNQAPVVDEFIDALMKHFTLPDSHTLMVPHPREWPLTEYIVVRIVEDGDSPIVTVCTDKGVIVLNAALE